MPASHMECLALVPDSSILLVQGGISGDSGNALPAAHVGDLNCVLLLWPSSASAPVGICRLSQAAGVLSLYLCVSIFISLLYRFSASFVNN